MSSVSLLAGHLGEDDEDDDKRYSNVLREAWHLLHYVLLDDAWVP